MDLLELPSVTLDLDILSELKGLGETDLRGSVCDHNHIKWDRYKTQITF